MIILKFRPQFGRIRRFLTLLLELKPQKCRTKLEKLWFRWEAVISRVNIGRGSGAGRVTGRDNYEPSAWIVCARSDARASLRGATNHCCLLQTHRLYFSSSLNGLITLQSVKLLIESKKEYII